MTNTPEYKAYYDMLTRCYNKKSWSYRFYGARGIKVCERWLVKFSNFYEDMGNKPSKIHSLDRKNNNGDYSKYNCRWVVREIQDVNTRRAIILNGEKISLRKLAKEKGFKRGTIDERIRAGMSIESAISKPLKNKINKNSNFPGVFFDKRRKSKQWIVGSKDRKKNRKSVSFNDLNSAIEYAKSIGWKK